MGVLYRATDPVLERDVAIKVMAADFSDDETGRSRFYREARAVARLQHRNIVTLFDFGEEAGAPYIVMEFLRGQTLAARLRGGAPLPVDQALDIAAQLGTGLHFAHAHGIIHRDVKPANIWLLDDGGVKLLDFGIAKFGESTLTTAGDVVGSIAYMSPEQLRGDPTDTRADIFSAGIVLYELLAGKRPFSGETPTAIMMQIINGEPQPIERAASLPPGLSAIVMRALEKTPDRRYQHGAELATDLQALRASFERSGAATRPNALPETLPAFVSTPTPRPASHTPRPSSRESAPAALTTLGPAPTSPPPSLVETFEEEDLIRRDVAGTSGSDHDIDLDLVTDASGAASRSAGSAGAASTSRSGQSHPFPAPASNRRGWRPAGAVACVALLGYVGFVIFRAAAPATTGDAADPAKQATQAQQTATPSVPTPGSSAPSTSRPGTPRPGAGQPETVQPEEPITPKPPASERQNPRSGPEPSATRPHSTRPEPAAPPAPTTPPVSQAGFWVAITGAYPFEVQTEDGQVSRSSTRHELQVSGKQTLRLRAPQFALDRRVPVDGPAGGTVRLQAPALGRLTIRTPFETCEALVNGRSLGFPPIVDQQLASGTYRIVLSCPDGDKHFETVQITAGQTETALIR
jgi:serine/threonine-protein kinase